MAYQRRPVNTAMPLAMKGEEGGTESIGGAAVGSPSPPRTTRSGRAYRWWGPSATHPHPPPPRNEGARARTLKLQALFSCFGSGVHHTEGGGRRGRGGTAAAGGKLALLPAPRHGPGALVGGVVGATLVPLHVPDAPNRLDLGVLSAEI